MRKNYKQKRRSCALCKPHKVGWDTRWTAKEAALRKAMELESQRVSCQDCIDLIDAQTALGRKNGDILNFPTHGDPAPSSAHPPLSISSSPPE